MPSSQKNNFVTQIDQHIDSGIDPAAGAQIPQEPDDRIMMEDYRNNAVRPSDFFRLASHQARVYPCHKSVF